MFHTARAQEHSEQQLAQCRERLVARTEQLLMIDAASTVTFSGGVAQATVGGAAAEIAEELRRCNAWSVGDEGYMEHGA